MMTLENVRIHLNLSFLMFKMKTIILSISLSDRGLKTVMAHSGHPIKVLAMLDSSRPDQTGNSEPGAH